MNHRSSVFPPASRLHEDDGVRLVFIVTAAASVTVLVPVGLFYLGSWLLGRPAEWWRDVAAIVVTGLGLVVIGFAMELMERAGARRRTTDASIGAGSQLRKPLYPQGLSPRVDDAAAAASRARLQLVGMGHTRRGTGR